MNKGLVKIIEGLLMIMTFFILTSMMYTISGVETYSLGVSKMFCSGFCVIFIGGLYGIILGTVQIVKDKSDKR